MMAGPSAMASCFEMFASRPPAPPRASQPRAVQYARALLLGARVYAFPQARGTARGREPRRSHVKMGAPGRARTRRAICFGGRVLASPARTCLAKQLLPARRKPSEPRRRGVVHLSITAEAVAEISTGGRGEGDHPGKRAARGAAHEGGNKSCVSHCPPTGRPTQNGTWTWTRCWKLNGAEI